LPEIRVLKIRAPKDFAGGLILVALGLGAIVAIADQPFGTAFRIGPAFAPIVVASLIAMLGALLAAQSFCVAGPEIEIPVARPVSVVLVAFTAFGLLIENFGLVVAAIVLVVVATHAESGANWRRGLGLGLGLAALSVLIFRILLGLPIPVLPRWI